MRKIYLTESQYIEYKKYLLSEALDEKFSFFSGDDGIPLKNKLYVYFLIGSATLGNIYSFLLQNEIPKEQAIEMVKEISREFDYGGWQLADDKSIITVYNAVAVQCNADYGTTASGFKLNLDDVGSHRIAAVERTFMDTLGIKYGDVIKIEGTHNGLFDGIYQVQDTMNKRFAGQHKIDLLVPNNIKFGGTMPDQYAKVYVLKDKSYTNNILNTMSPSNEIYECPD